MSLYFSESLRFSFFFGDLAGFFCLCFSFLALAFFGVDDSVSVLLKRTLRSVLSKILDLFLNFSRPTTAELEPFEMGVLGVDMVCSLDGCLTGVVGRELILAGVVDEICLMGLV